VPSAPLRQPGEAAIARIERTRGVPRGFTYTSEPRSHRRVALMMPIIGV
jgi:hypothetical protein